MKIFKNCTSIDFKSDLSNLCDNCPIRPAIIEGIENQIIFQAMERKDILSEKDFNLYIENEINNASKAMERVFLHERQASTIDPKGIYIENRVRTYIWNKERIKALNHFKKQNVIKNEHQSIFSENGFYLFNYILDEFIKPKNQRGRYSEIAFYYWKMYNDGYVHQRPEKFKSWFNDLFDDDLDKIKTLDQVSNTDRIKHYSNALDWLKQ